MQLKLSDIWCFSFLSIKTYSDVNLLFDLIWHLLLVSFYLTSTLLDSTTRPTYLSPLALSESNIFWQHLPTLQQAKIFKDNFSFPVILFIKTKAVFISFDPNSSGWNLFFVSSSLFCLPRLCLNFLVLVFFDPLKKSLRKNKSSRLLALPCFKINVMLRRKDKDEWIFSDQAREMEKLIISTL